MKPADERTKLALKGIFRNHRKAMIKFGRRVKPGKKIRPGIIEARSAIKKTPLLNEINRGERNQ